MDYVARNVMSQPAFGKNIQRQESVSNSMVHSDAHRILLLHPPRHGMQFLWKNNPDPEYLQPGAFYIVGLVLNGGEWVRARMSLTLSVIITVATLSLGVAMPLLANPEFVFLEKYNRGVNGTLQDEPTADSNLVKAYHILIACAVASELWSLITSFGIAFLLNQSLRDIDLVNTLHFVAWTEFFFCYLPLMVGILCQVTALGIKGFIHFTPYSAVPACVILFIGYFGVSYFTIKLGHSSWAGINGGKTNDNYHGWNCNVEICNKILKALSDLSPELEANRINSTVPVNLSRLDLQVMQKIVMTDEAADKEAAANKTKAEEVGGFGQFE